MPDIRLVPVTAVDIVTLDWLQTSTGQLDETSELASAVTVALCSDALALPSEVLPDPNADDRRGWWADANADTIWGGWPIGSKLWLLTRAKILDAGAREGATVTRVQAYIQMALQPFIDKKICSRVAVSARQVNIQRIDAEVTLYRGPKSAIALAYQALWGELSPAYAPGPRRVVSPPLETSPRLDYGNLGNSGYLPGLN